MAAPTPQLEWAGDLATAIQEAGDQHARPPRHVLNRLAALLYPHEVKHVDVNLASADGHGMRLNGKITLFTDDVVAVVTVRDLLGMTTQPRQIDLHQDTRVQVSVVPRRALLSISLLQEDGSHRNSSAAWEQEDVGEWPIWGRAAFHFDGIDEPVVMPSGRNITDFEQFLPALWKDLTG